MPGAMKPRNFDPMFRSCGEERLDIASKNKRDLILIYNCKAERLKKKKKEQFFPLFFFSFSYLTRTERARFVHPEFLHHSTSYINQGYKNEDLLTLKITAKSR